MMGNNVVEVGRGGGGGGGGVRVIIYVIYFDQVNLTETRMAHGYGTHSSYETKPQDPSWALSSCTRVFVGSNE